MEAEPDVNTFVKSYVELVQHPSVESARIITLSPDIVIVKSAWNQRNIHLGEVSTFRKHHIVLESSMRVVHETVPDDISSQEMTSTSETEKFHCIVRKSKKEGKKKQYLEIWTRTGMYKNFDVGSFDAHGEIYCDGEFGTLEWSPDDEKILYLAEKKVKKSQPFYPQKSGDENNGKLSPTGDEYIYRPDWGEQLVSKHQPVVCVCDLVRETIKVVDGIPENFSPAQLLWDKDGTGFFGVAIENEPRRLGLLYCSNRAGYIFHLSLDGEFKILSEPHKSVRTPRLSLDGKSLFWLERAAGGPHSDCQTLIKLDLASNKKETKLGIVPVPGEHFSGLFSPKLPPRCFSSDGTNIFFSGYHKFRLNSYYLNLETNELRLLPMGEESTRIFDVYNDLIVLSAESMNKPPVLLLAKFSRLQWIGLTKDVEIFRNPVLKEIEFESENRNDSFTYYNAIYYGPPEPTSNKKVPLIVYPHGGPHSITANEYNFELSFFVSLGYGVLNVNYRGSTGVGQKGVLFLVGKIGDTDVKDNHEAVLKLLKMIPYLDEKNIYLFGRSHGGFLAQHLSAQYPDFYRAVVCANAVSDVADIYSMSDIPDWATSVSGYPFDETKPLTLEQLKKMFKSSPIHLAEKIKAPTLFLVGKNDLRVPFYEGIRMYHLLKARKVKTRLNVYEDNHNLGITPHHIDHLINTVVWFANNKA